MVSHFVSDEQLFAETVISIQEAGKHFPRPISQSSIERFVNFGKNGVKLQIFRIGNSRMTTRESIMRWLSATQRQADNHSVRSALPLKQEKPAKEATKEIESLRQRYGLPLPGKDGQAVGQN